MVAVRACESQCQGHGCENRMALFVGLGEQRCLHGLATDTKTISGSTYPVGPERFRGKTRCPPKPSASRRALPAWTESLTHSNSKINLSLFQSSPQILPPSVSRSTISMLASSGVATMVAPADYANASQLRKVVWWLLLTRKVRTILERPITLTSTTTLRGCPS